MKKLLIVAAVLSLCASTAMAVPIDPKTDGIGIYFDTGATNNCLAANPGLITAYLIATNVSRGGVGGWEGTLLLNPTIYGLANLDIGSAALNVLTPPKFQVGFNPARSGTVVTLLTIQLFSMGGPVVMGIAPCLPSSFGGTNPGYGDPNDPAILLPLTPSSNVPWTLPIYKGQNTDSDLPANGPANGFVVAGVATSPCPVAAENSTWGSVKDLYK